MNERTSPSGITIRYRSDKEEGGRQYWVRARQNVWPYPDWIEVPSVTEVLDILDKPALPWWGMRMGFDAVLAALEREELVWFNGAWHIQVPDESDYDVATRETIEAWAKHNCLTTNDVRDAGGVRGQAAHDVLEAWATTGALAMPQGYPEEQAGYVEAVLKFCGDATMTGTLSELMVGSVQHRFAGRCDLRGRLTGEVWIGLGTRAKTHVFDNDLVTLDLKTSKNVYTQHLLQLEAYDLAGVECGYPPTDYRLALLARPDGRYKVVFSDRTWDDFVAVRRAYDAVQRRRKT